MSSWTKQPGDPQASVYASFSTQRLRYTGYNDTKHRVTFKDHYDINDPIVRQGLNFGLQKTFRINYTTNNRTGGPYGDGTGRFLVPTLNAFFLPPGTQRLRWVIYTFRPLEDMDPQSSKMPFAFRYGTRVEGMYGPDSEWTHTPPTLDSITASDYVRILTPYVSIMAQDIHGVTQDNVGKWLYIRSFNYTSTSTFFDSFDATLEVDHEIFKSWYNSMSASDWQNFDTEKPHFSGGGTSPSPSPGGPKPPFPEGVSVNILPDEVLAIGPQWRMIKQN